jgi:uncharacterized protein YeeX (DUF496 family)
MEAFTSNDMSHDQVEKIMKKLDCFEKKLDNHISSSADFRTETTAFMAALMPFKDGLSAFQSVIRFLKFIGIPTTLVLAFIYWFIKKL